MCPVRWGPWCVSCAVRRMLEFVFRMLALGSNTLPAAGIGAIPEQLAAALPADTVRLNTRVTSLQPSGADGAGVRIETAGGRTLVGRLGVIVAVEQPEAERLLGAALASSPSATGPPRGTVCLYFDAPAPPAPDAILYLNGTEEGMINNLCFPSTVAPGYAPEGRTLVSVSLVGTWEGTGEDELVQGVQRELQQWFPDAGADTWRHIRTYRIPFAQPDQRPPSDLLRPLELPGRVFVCGDHRRSATFDGALLSGRLAAEGLLAPSPAAEAVPKELEAASV